jgi:PhnB protein
MKQLSVYLHFNGNCREAMEFYKKCLGGELNLHTFAGSPMEAQAPPSEREKVLHAILETDGMVLVADDMLESRQVTFGDNFSLYVSAASMKEIQAQFNKLAEGGKVTQPITKAPFGYFGVLLDKFGISWIFRSEKP